MKKATMLDNCIDCKNPLFDENRSKHQPGIRCLSCFEVFADKTQKTLKNMIADMEKD